MPLSDHEQRLLEQMERALYAEDPKFADSLRKTRRPAVDRKRMTLGIVGVAAGLAILLAGVATSLPLVGVLGFLATVAGAFVAYNAFSAKATTEANGTAAPAGRAQGVRRQQQRTDGSARGTVAQAPRRPRPTLNSVHRPGNALLRRGISFTQPGAGNGREMATVDDVALNKVFHDHECAYYDERFGIVHDEASARKAQQEVEELLGETLPPAAVVLDVGCGTGWFAAGLGRARPDVTVVGLDLSAGMLGKATEAGATRLVQGDATRLPFADSSIDVVVGRGVLHHLPDPLDPPWSSGAGWRRPTGSRPVQ